MRKIASLVLLALMLPLIVRWSQNIPLAMAKSSAKMPNSFYNGNLTISGNQVYIIQNEIFNINGSIFVTENATLILRNATLNFTQMDNGQFLMKFINASGGHPRFIAENATITANNYQLHIYFDDNSTAALNFVGVADGIRFFVYSTSTFNATNVEFYYASVQHNAQLILENCSVDYVYVAHYAKANITDTEILNVLQATWYSEITISDCYINTAVGRNYSKSHIYDSHIQSASLYDNSISWVVNVDVEFGYIYDNASLYIYWYLSVYVTDFIGEAISSANVTVYYENGTLAESKLTDINGLAKFTLLMGYLVDGNQYPAGTYTIVTSYMGYSNQTFIDLTSNINIDIHLGFIKTYPAYYNGDITLDDNELLCIEGLLNINGSIYVTENATLILHNAWINFTQQANYQFKLMCIDNSHINIENSNITSNLSFVITFNHHTSATIDKLFTTAYSTYAYGYSTSVISNSSFHSLFLGNYVDAVVSNCTMNDLSAYNNATCIVSNCSIGSWIDIQLVSANATISNLKGGYINYWNLYESCSIEIASPGFAPNLTIVDTNVNGWTLNLYGTANITLMRSSLRIIQCYYSSRTMIFQSQITFLTYMLDNAYCRAEDSSLGVLHMYDNTQAWVYNSTRNGELVHDNARLYVGWHLNVHVVDQMYNNVPNANITVYDSEGYTVAYGKTNQNGVYITSLLEKMVNATGSYPYGEYRVEAQYETYSVDDQVLMNQNINLTLELPFIYSEFPSTLMLLITFAILTAATAYAKKKQKQP